MTPRIEYQLTHKLQSKYRAFSKQRNGLDYAVLNRPLKKARRNAKLVSRYRKLPPKLITYFPSIVVLVKVFQLGLVQVISLFLRIYGIRILAAYEHNLTSKFYCILPFIFRQHRYNYMKGLQSQVRFIFGF